MRAYKKNSFVEEPNYYMIFLKLSKNLIKYRSENNFIEPLNNYV